MGAQLPVSFRVCMDYKTSEMSMMTPTQSVSFYVKFIN